MASSERDEPQSEFNINTHRLRIVPPDIVKIWWIGSCTRDDFERLFEVTERRLSSRTYFVIANVSQLETVDSSVRALVARDPRMQRVAGLAIWGASFHIRVIMTMLARAMNAFHSAPAGKLGVFDAENDAIAWITKERALRNAR